MYAALFCTAYSFYNVSKLSIEFLSYTAGQQSRWSKPSLNVVQF